MSASDAIELVGRIVGTDSVVAGDEPAFTVADVSITADGMKPRKQRYRSSFRLKTEDGDEVTIDASAASLSGGKTERTHAVFSKLSSNVRALISPFEAGPDFPVKVEAKGFRVGDTIAVEGCPTSWRAPDGYRGEAVARSPETVAASAIRSPSAASAASFQRQHAPARGIPFRAGRDLWLFACIVYGVALALFGLIGLGTPEFLAEALLRGAWVSVGLSASWLLVARFTGYLHLFPEAPKFLHLRPFLSLDAQKEPIRTPGGEHAIHVDSLLVLTAISLLLSLRLIQARFGLLDEPPVDLGQGDALWAAFALTVLCGLGIFRLTASRERAPRRRARSITKAPARSGDAGGFASVEGTLERGFECHIVVHEYRFGSRRHMVQMQQELHLPDDISVRTNTGSVTVSLAGATFSTDDWYAVEIPHEEAKTFRSASSTGTWKRYVFEALPGAATVVAGAFEPGARHITARGPESLFISTSEAGNPRAFGRAKSAIAYGAAAVGLIWAVTSAAFVLMAP